MSKIIPLAPRGRYAIVDDWNYERLMGMEPWRCMESRDKTNMTVVRDTFVGSQHYVVNMSTCIKGLPPEGYIWDHIDRNGLNNQEDNLRLATMQQNTFNASRKRNNTWGYIGVALHKRDGVWVAKIQYNYLWINLGTYDTIEEAALAHDVAVYYLHKEFAVYNDPPGLTPAMVQTISRKVESILVRRLGCLGVYGESPTPQQIQTCSTQGDTADASTPPVEGRTELEKLESEFSDLL